MAKAKKVKKTKKTSKKAAVKSPKTKVKVKTKEEEIKQVECGEEEVEAEKDGGTLSDGVLDAFDEVAPTDSLLASEEDEEVAITEEEDEDDEMDSGDYHPLNEW